MRGLLPNEIREAGFSYLDMMLGGFCPDEVEVSGLERLLTLQHCFRATGATAQSRRDVVRSDPATEH